MIDYTNTEEAMAKELAEAVNGGSWSTDYTPAQKAGWIRKVQYVLKHWISGDNA